MEHEEQEDQEALKLDRLLKQRAEPPESPKLVARIIEATMQSVPKKEVYPNLGIMGLLAEVIPQPIHILFTVLLLGFLCGYVIPPQISDSIPSPLQLTKTLAQDFFMADETETPLFP